MSVFDVFLFAYEENSPCDPLFANSPFLAEKSSECVPIPFPHFGLNSAVKKLLIHLKFRYLNVSSLDTI
jgi:hypothetical protein